MKPVAKIRCRAPRGIAWRYEGDPFDIYHPPLLDACSPTRPSS